MSILASLAHAYDRLQRNDDVPPFGYTRVEVGYCIVLRLDGSVAFDPIDLRSGDGRRKTGLKKNLPTPLSQRTSGIKPNFLWDKTAYSLGVTAGNDRRTSEEHSAFVSFHEKALSSSDDPGLKAFLRFLETWKPKYLAERKWPAEIMDTNIVFALDGTYKDSLLHERPAAIALWEEILLREPASFMRCLVLGETQRIMNSHPPIKNVMNAQSSGAFIVSFNDDAYTSYGHKGGDNAPISELAAFKYTSALNRFLERDSGHRIQIGDASTVFWADASQAEVAETAEGIFGAMFQDVDEKMQADKVGDLLDKIRKGKQIKEIAPELEKGVRFFVLGLAPNAARLSVRFYFEDDFGILARNYQAYVKDMKIEPWPAHRPLPTIKSCVLRTAPARRDHNNRVKFDTDSISPLLSGELLRSILTGARFPGALLSLLVMRVRTDHLLDSIRIALIKGLIVRSMRVENRLPEFTKGIPEEEYLVRSQPDDPNPARRLGRLFAILERAQLSALGEEINTTIKDKYLGAAAATPQQVFVGIIKNAQHHTKRLRNGHSDASWITDAVQARRIGAALDRDIGRLWATFENGVPAQHSIEEQGLFLVGYYQERYGGKADPESDGEPENEAEVIIDGE